MKETSKILVVDDDEYVLLSIKLLLEPHFSSVETITNPERIPALLPLAFDVVILDMNFRQGVTDGHEGLFWARKILKENNPTQVILITAYADIQLAIDSIRDGVLDFIVKPWHNNKLLATVKMAAALSRERKKVDHLNTRQRALASAMDQTGEQLIGESDGIKNLRRTISKVAVTDASIIILGPNGTGKEVVAREIHRRSHRKEGPFISVDLGSLSPTLFESELFGHCKGAFTDAREDRMGRFEAAAGGTIFLDEIANLTQNLQAKLLTVLQQKVVTRLGTHKPVALDVRVICATNADLKKMVTENGFREDLLYRLNTVEINVPSLSERKGDIPLLANYFLDRLARKYGKPWLTATEEIQKVLMSYPWPGNVRQLQHALERAVIMSEDKMLTVEDLGLNSEDGGENKFDHFNLESIEGWAIRKALDKHRGNVSHAADELGLSRGALYRRMQKYGI